jgi:hypothetical protein
MPDHHGFDHLPNWGAVTVRCVACGAEGPLWQWPERARQRHAEAHAREAASDRERAARARLREARRLKAQAERENALAYGSGE